MARKFLTPIDLNKNELQNAVIQNLASAPSSPALGQIYFDTAVNELLSWNGTAWRQADGFATGLLTGRPAAATANSGTFYYAIDNYLLYYSNGTTWQQTNNFGSGLSSSVVITGTSADGTSTNYARADHNHAGPGFGNVTGTTTYGIASGNGSALTVARSDHSHGTPALSTNAATNITATASTNGTGTTPAKDDHVHGFTPGNFSVSAFAAAAANVSLGGFKLTNVGTPTADTDAANKAYVDGVTQGLNIHDSAKLATTTNLVATYTPGTTGADGGTGVGATLTITATGVLTIDGVATALNDRILVKNQTNQLHNGIYRVSTAGATGVSAVLTRASDDDNNISGEVTAGDFVFVVAGTQAATGWVQSNEGTAVTPIGGIKIGTDPIYFTQFSGAGAYTGGNGLTQTGTTFDVGAGLGILSNTNDVAIDTAVVVRKYSTSIGDAAATSIAVTHNLNTRDVTVGVYLANGTYEEVNCDIQHTSVNVVTLLFSIAPTLNQYRVVVHG